MWLCPEAQIHEGMCAQLWINVPAKHKMEKPRYQDVQDGDIPAIEKDGVKVCILCYGVEPFKL